MSEPRRLEETPPLERVGELKVIDPAELARLRQNSERWERTRKDPSFLVAEEAVAGDDEEGEKLTIKLLVGSKADAAVDAAIAAMSRLATIQIGPGVAGSFAKAAGKN